MGRAYALSDLMESEGGYNAVLERAKRTAGYAECGCAARPPLPKLQIRRHGTSYLLARWPDQAHLHTKACPFGRAWAGRSEDAEATAPFMLRNGVLDIRLDLALTVLPRALPAAPAQVPSGEARGAGRRTAGLLAFLEYAWEAAGLNSWSANERRTWASCWSRLTAELGNGQINGQPAADILHIIRRYEPDKRAEINHELDTFLDRLKSNADEKRRGVVIGEIQSLEPSQFGGVLVLRQNNRRYYLSQAAYKATLQAHGTALSGIGRHGARCVAILAVSHSDKRYLKAVEVAAMLTNAVFIPCDSSYELAMADRLIREARAFIKPLRHVDQAAVHPDFVLRDTGKETVIEVYGMVGNAEYDRKVTEKRQHYARLPTPVVEWIPPGQALERVVLPPIKRGA
ncbi:DUF1173 family protein [Cupriavidus sp. CuC1]|uniref:DUF1173 family protein n=1 Tax=Cupriavidus sp. CuC1 TaxID=3373131 RepID=UPI0037CD3D38